LLEAEDEAYDNVGHEEISCVAMEERRIKLNLDLYKNIIEAFKNDSFNMYYSESEKLIFVVPFDPVNGNDKFFTMAPLLLNPPVKKEA
jgi:hypothetical protein